MILLYQKVKISVIYMKLNGNKRQVFHFIRNLLFIVLLFFMRNMPAELIIDEILLSKIEHKYGKKSTQRILQWQALLETAVNLPEQEKLTIVNDFFNQRIAFVDDMRLWNKPDYWATPLEVLVRGAGDCEDYSIAKYFTLKELGVAESKMRITYVKALKLNQTHMVLTYYPSPREVPLVLDNLRAAIQPATQRSDLLPVYSFNGAGLWMAKIRGQGKRVGNSDRLNRWDELTRRMLDYSF